jgi:ribosomal protein S12 methylthiotransferase
MKKKKINIITLGCSKNTVDSEKLLRQISSAGYSIVHDSEDMSAGTVIINTCGFINDAREESIDTILRYAQARESGRINKLYVMGCMSELYIDSLKEEIPEVDKYFGVNSMKDILNELGNDIKTDLLLERTLTGPSHYAYLKISEGCDRTCSFCTIPKIRGKYFSRPAGEIVNEASLLARNGVQELLLIAQDLSYYGLDLYGKQYLPALLKELLKIEQFKWIRLHYLYPANFPNDLIPLINECPTLCRYIDIPVQHITDKMLKIMRRSHNRKETVAILDRIRKDIPGVALRTTLIVGHPGESKKDFNELKKFIEDFRFDRLGVFEYSHEENTWSYNHYNDSIPAEEKKRRADELMEIQQSVSLQLNNARVGQTMEILVDRTETEFHIGRTEFDSPEVDQEVLIPAQYNLSPGKYYDIMITEATEFDLFGMPV